MDLMDIAMARALGGSGGGGGSLPSAEWDATVTIGFEAQSTTATINGTSFTKCSDKAMTASQLDGATFAMGGSTITLSQSDLTDMSSLNVTGTMINVTGFGNVCFCCTEAGSVVSEPGTYLVTQMISYASMVTLSYTEHLSASTRAIAVGDMEMEDGTTDLPTGVVYLQYES